jgi:hypothetical protein
MELIIGTNRMVFENKVQVAKILLDNKGFIASNPTIINDIIKKVIPERNIFAHYWLVTSEDLTNWVRDRKTIFIKFKNTTEHIEYDDIKFGDIMKDIAKCITSFISLSPQKMASPTDTPPSAPTM